MISLIKTPIQCWFCQEKSYTLGPCNLCFYARYYIPRRNFINFHRLINKAKIYIKFETIEV